MRLYFGSAMALAAISACSSPAISQGSVLRSGLYEGMVLSVSPGGRVVGSYREEQGDAPSKSCAFTFSGQVRGSGAAITASDGSARGPGRLAGRLTVSGQDVTLVLPRARSMGGCGLVLMPEVETEGMPLSRLAAGAWTDLAKVKDARLALRAAPTAAPGRAYVVRGDVVGIVGRRGAAVEIVYPSDRAKPTRGWVPAAALAPVAG